MESEMKIFIKLWISAIASLSYCYFISFNIPKGKFRFLSLLPVFYFLTILPLSLTSVTLGGLSSFFLTWLANFKLLLFSFGEGPLSLDPSISLSHFISIACFPIKLKTPSPQISQTTVKSTLNFTIKVLVLVLLSLAYGHIQYLHPKLILAYYCCYLYVVLEFYLQVIAFLVGKFLGLELESQFDEPYLSTSLQDFWGRRWNLMVTNILRPTVYLPTRLIVSKKLGSHWGQLVAVYITFLASGLMHEVMIYHLDIRRRMPTWEVTGFFALHGVLLVLEIGLKKALKDRWRLHPVLSWAFTVAILMVTSNWLFFPPMLRCEVDVRSSQDAIAIVDFYKNFAKSFDDSAY
ncbi:hypothetical protein ACHQM5_003074 [Ranunculus cassubicifolius]